MNISVINEGGDVTVLELSGRMGAVDMAQPGVVEKLQAAATQRTNAVIDMSGLEFLASLGIRFLFQAAKALQAKGGKLILAAPGPLVREALSSSGTDTVLKVADSRDQALALL